MTDSEYQERRNRLIPKAEKYTNEKVGEKPPDAYAGSQKRANYDALWTRTFHRRMTYLAKKEGLIN